MSLSNDEVLELLNQKYTAEQIAIAFRVMAEAGYKVSSNDTHFDADVVEELERILAAASKGIEQQRALPQTQQSKSDKQTLDEIVELTQVQLNRFGVDPRLTATIVQTVLAEEVKQALAFNLLRQKVAAIVWDQGSTAIAEGIVTSRRNETKFITDLAENSEAIAKMLNGYGITGGGGERLIKESRVQAISTKKAVDAFFQQAQDSVAQFESQEEDSLPLLNGKPFHLMQFLEGAPDNEE